MLEAGIVTPAPTAIEKQQAVENVPEAGKSWRNLFTAFLLVALATLGQFLETVAPDLSNMVVSFFPFLIPFAPYVKAAVLAVAAFLIRRGKAQSQTAVVEAQKMPSTTGSNDIMRHYGKP